MKVFCTPFLGIWKIQLDKVSNKHSSLDLLYTGFKYISSSVGYCLFVHRFSRTSKKICNQLHTFFISSTKLYSVFQSVGFCMIHIGNLIEIELRKQERSVSWFANKLYCDRTNVYSIFKRESIDTALLLRISIVLEHNFFHYYTEQYLDR